MEKKLNKTKIAILIHIILIFIIGLTIVIISSSQTIEKDGTEFPTEENTLEYILKYFDCTDINVKQSEEEDIDLDIYLSIGKPLWENGRSNEPYYNELFIHLFEKLEGKNFRLIDTTKDITILVLYDKEQKDVKAVYINGEVNYFSKTTSQKKNETVEYNEIQKIEMNIESKEIQGFIKNEWKADSVSLGTLESRFNDYDIYFDEGIEIKTVGSKVYNLIYTNKYTKNIVNGLKVTSSNEDIIKKLGEPQFKTSTAIGYKGEDIYIFFYEEEVSIYRIEKDYSQDKFLKLWNEFYESKNAKVFTDKIMTLWKDYDKYYYLENSVELQYTLRGLVFRFNVLGENGMAIYANFEGNLPDGTTLKDYDASNLPEHIYLHIEEDIVFSEEQKRRLDEETMYNPDYLMLESTGETGKNRNEDGYINYRFNTLKSNEFTEIYSYNGKEGIYNVKFVSKNREYPNSELIKHKQIYTFGWLNDEQFLYSVKNTGIYYYNAKTRVLKTLKEGNEVFKIERVENEKIIYDGTSYIEI